MGSGCYDLDGRCVNCKKLHPCDCETEQDEQEIEMFKQEAENIGGN